MPAHIAFLSQGMYLCFVYENEAATNSFLDRATIDAFHVHALKAGGKDNGAPGLREYHANYYAAFVHDPAGNNIEVVCHKAE